MIHIGITPLVEGSNSTSSVTSQQQQQNSNSIPPVEGPGISVTVQQIQEQERLLTSSIISSKDTEKWTTWTVLSYHEPIRHWLHSLSTAINDEYIFDIFKYPWKTEKLFTFLYNTFYPFLERYLYVMHERYIPWIQVTVGERPPQGDYIAWYQLEVLEEEDKRKKKKCPLKLLDPTLHVRCKGHIEDLKEKLQYEYNKGKNLYEYEKDKYMDHWYNHLKKKLEILSKDLNELMNLREELIPQALSSGIKYFTMEIEAEELGRIAFENTLFSHLEIPTVFFYMYMWGSPQVISKLRQRLSIVALTSLDYTWIPAFQNRNLHYLNALHHSIETGPDTIIPVLSPASISLVFPFLFCSIS